MSANTKQNNLADARVLITGAAVGIGAGIATHFGRQGCRVGVHYHSHRAEAEALCKEIRQTGEATMFQAELLEASSPENLVSAFIEEFGGIDVLVNNAGACYEYKHFTEVSLDAVRRTYELNFMVPFQLSRAAFSLMQKQGSGGRIINITSGSAKFGGSEKNMHYAAAKSALDTLTVGLARAGAQHDILVNSIRCGIIDSGMQTKVDGYSEERYQERVAMVPLGRAGSVDDVAQLVLFLASSGGNYITGEILSVAGGE